MDTASYPATGGPLKLELLDQLTQRLGKGRQRLVVPALAAANEAQQSIAQLHQPLIGRRGAGCALEGGLLPLRQVACLQLAAGQQVIGLRILGAWAAKPNCVTV